jgi:hypothetical protein
LRIKEQETRLTLHEYDDEDDNIILLWGLGGRGEHFKIFGSVKALYYVT